MIIAQEARSVCDARICIFIRCGDRSNPESGGMKILPYSAFARILALGLLIVLGAYAHAQAQTDPLPSWNNGPAKQAILTFVKEATTEGSPRFVDPAARIAAFDQDGTTWVEQPLYAQVAFAFHQVGVMASKDPKLKDAAPFRTVLSGDRQAIAKLTQPDLEKVLAVTHTGMTVDVFQKDVQDWIATAQHPRFHRLYTELVYQPMLEVMQYLRANGFRTYIVTGGGQDFVRGYSERAYGIPREQIVGSTAGTTFGYDKQGKSQLTKMAKGARIDDERGKPIGIYLMTGRRPVAAFGNSTGDQEMLEYTQDGGGARLMMLVHHDDATREYAYGAESNIGTFSDALTTEANKRGWVIISMKNDWKRIFAWEQ
jgi:phosphoglycolate phosphatase-like HAD superfamily hydrolase